MLDFIKKCLQIDPKKRMTCEEAIRHDWFKDLLMESERELEFKLSSYQDTKSPFSKGEFTPVSINKQ